MNFAEGVRVPSGVRGRVRCVCRSHRDAATPTTKMFLRIKAYGAFTMKSCAISMVSLVPGCAGTGLCPGRCRIEPCKAFFCSGARLTMKSIKSRARKHGESCPRLCRDRALPGTVSRRTFIGVPIRSIKNVASSSSYSSSLSCGQCHRPRNDRNSCGMPADSLAPKGRFFRCFFATYLETFPDFLTVNR